MYTSLTSPSGGNAGSWPEEITIADVTPRDGLQDADRLISTAQKVQLIRDLLDAGLRHIEVTSFVHPDWVPQMADADHLAASLPHLPDVTYRALVPNMRGYERAHAAGVTEIMLVVSASESHNRANLNRSISETLAQLSEVVTRAQSDGITVCGAISTAFGCPFEGAVPATAVMRIAHAYAQMGVRHIALADTIGVGNPRHVYELFSDTRREMPSDAVLTAHFHDRQGYALANVFAAIQAGITHFDAALGGLGGCPYAPGAPGNLSTEAVVNFLEQMGFATHLSSEKLVQARIRVLEALAHGEPASKQTHHQPQAPLPPRWQEVADYVAQFTDPVGNPMDAGIIEAVVALNLLDVATTSSCEGHLDHGLAAPWIDFHTPGTGATRRKVSEITVRLQQAEEQHAPQKTIDALTHEYFQLAAEAEKESFSGPWAIEQALIAFYHDRHVDHDRQIFIHSDSFGISRLQSHGIDYQALQTTVQRASRLAAYQQEMQDFATFLKTDYLLKVVIGGSDSIC